MDTISKKDVSKLSKSIRVFENWIKNNYKKEDYSGLENFELNEKRILLLQSRLFDELLKEHLKVLDNSSNNNAIEFTKQEMSKTFDFQRNFVTVQEVNLIDKRKEEFYNHIAITYNYVIKAKRNISILGFVIDHDEQNIKIEVKANINTGNGLFINDSFIVNVAKM